MDGTKQKQSARNPRLPEVEVELEIYFPFKSLIACEGLLLHDARYANAAGNRYK